MTRLNQVPSLSRLEIAPQSAREAKLTNAIRRSDGDHGAGPGSGVDRALEAQNRADSWPPPVSALYRSLKRTTDLAISAIVLAIGAPLWLAIGLVIRVTSPGPALYSRQVVGKDGRYFTYYKFRSMRAGDDRHHREWLRDFVNSDQPYGEQDGRPIFKAINDARVTPIGRWLRRSSLDEIPQLINVLRGDMSLVGPRPPIVAEYELYDADMRRRLAVRPGITGYYQVTARSQVPFSRMVALDCEYIAQRSSLLDIRIIGRTPFAMIKGSGAS